MASYRYILIKSLSAGSYYSFFVPIKAAELDNTKTKHIKPSELSLYDEPKKVEYVLEPEKVSSFRSQISKMRKFVWSYIDSMQDNIDTVKQKYETGKNHTQASLAYIREDSSLPARLAIITISGLGGVVAGFRGGKMKKTIYASVAMLIAASICYPQEAEKTYKGVWCMARQQLKDYFPFKGLKKEANILENKTNQKSKNSVNDIVDEVKDKAIEEKDDIINKIKDLKEDSKKDFGMSNSKDKDMYTSRQ